jgi:hypothetical protein
VVLLLSSIQILGYPLNLSHYFFLPHRLKLIICCLPYELAVQHVKRLCEYCKHSDYRLLGFTTWQAFIKAAYINEKA